MAINVTIERIGYKPLRNQPRLAPLITAIGFSFILARHRPRLEGRRAPCRCAVTSCRRGNVVRDRGRQLLVEGLHRAADHRLAALRAHCLVRSTKPGKAMRATAQDRDASAMMGINVDRTISFTFALGGALAGAAGVIYALYIGTSTFQLGFRLGLFAFTAAVLGGIGNLIGRRPRRHPARTDRGLQRGLRRRALDDHDRLLDPDPDPRLPAVGPARRAHAGGSVSDQGQPAQPQPQGDSALDSIRKVAANDRLRRYRAAPPSRSSSSFTYPYLAGRADRPRHR